MEGKNWRIKHNCPECFGTDTGENFLEKDSCFFYYKRLNVKVLHSYSENADLDMDAAKYVVPLPLSETDFR